MVYLLLTDWKYGLLNIGYCKRIPPSTAQDSVKVVNFDFWSSVLLNSLKYFRTVLEPSG